MFTIGHQILYIHKGEGFYGTLSPDKTKIEWESNNGNDVWKKVIFRFFLFNSVKHFLKFKWLITTFANVNVPFKVKTRISV